MDGKPLLCAIVCAALWLPQPVRAADLPDAGSVAGISGHPQSLPLDCESRSAADWAAFFGVAIDELGFFNALPKTDNPDTGFVGNVYDAPGNLPPWGYGIHEEPLARQLNAFGVPAQPKRNASESDLRAEIAAGRPVIVWYIYGFRVTTLYAYTASDGAAYTVAPFEHTGIVIGYDPSSYTVIDAFSGAAHRVDRAQFLNSWAVLGSRMIVNNGESPPSPPPASAPKSAPASTTWYTVQPGDSISTIAGRLGVDWTQLASVNGIYSPYIILVGQQLLIPGTAAPSPATPAAPAATAADNPSAPPATYTVQTGDSLSRIAQRFGLYWPTLASANDLRWPYIIYPNQTLNLPGR